MGKLANKKGLNNNFMSAKRIEITLHKGTPYSLKSVELSNWNGKIIICPRDALHEVRDITEANSPAIYFLLGDENSIYIGETDTLSTRLSNHGAKKDFWHEFVAFVSPNLTKSEVRFLEYALVKKIIEDGFADVQNTSIPNEPTVSPVTKDILNEFVEIASDVLVSIGYTFLSPSIKTNQAAKNGVEVSCVGPAAKANGVYSDEGLLVKSGSLARKEEMPAIPTGAMERRKTMVQNGVFIDVGESYRLEKDTLFDSPSMAAAVFLSRSANGRTEWKTNDGKTISDAESKMSDYKFGVWATGIHP